MLESCHVYVLLALKQESHDGGGNVDDRVLLEKACMRRRHWIMCICRTWRGAANLPLEGKMTIVT